MFIAVLTMSGIATAQSGTTSKFMQLGEGDRYWYLEGAVSTVSHLIATHNKQKGDCVANWYLKDRDNKRRQIEDTLTKYPAEGPTTIVLSLLTQACGELIAK